MRIVNIGGPVALGVIGAILYFAMSDMIPGVDSKMVGLILLVAAAVWLVIGLVANRPRSAVTSERTNVHGSQGAETVEREVRHDEV